jgi:hypothetical protein
MKIRCYLRHVSLEICSVNFYRGTSKFHAMPASMAAVSFMFFVHANRQWMFNAVHPDVLFDQGIRIIQSNTSFLLLYKCILTIKMMC